MAGKEQAKQNKNLHHPWSESVPVGLGWMTCLSESPVPFFFFQGSKGNLGGEDACGKYWECPSDLLMAISHRKFIFSRQNNGVCPARVPSWSDWGTQYEKRKASMGRLELWAQIVFFRSGFIPFSPKTTEQIFRIWLAGTSCGTRMLLAGCCVLLEQSSTYWSLFSILLCYTLASCPSLLWPFFHKVSKNQKVGQWKNFDLLNRLVCRQLVISLTCLSACSVLQSLTQ